MVSLHAGRLAKLADPYESPIFAYMKIKIRGYFRMAANAKFLSPLFVAVLCHAVAHIVACRSSKQMRWVAAWRIVALVANKNTPLWIGTSVCKSPCRAVGHPPALNPIHRESQHPIPVRRSPTPPFPTARRCNYHLALERLKRADPHWSSARVGPRWGCERQHAFCAALPCNPIRKPFMPASLAFLRD